MKGWVTPDFGFTLVPSEYKPYVLQQHSHCNLGESNMKTVSLSKLCRINYIT
jgi:hypothetical protein